MPTYLVTGGAGFIGSNFIHYITERRPDVRLVCLDKFTYAGNLDNLEALPAAARQRVMVVAGDINDADLVDSVFTRYDIDVVVHFAAESHVDRSIAGPRVFCQTNVLGTQCLLDIAANHWRKNGKWQPGKKFVHVSTDEVYGSLGPTGYFTEATPLAPRSPYSASKAGADFLVQAYHTTYGMPVNITRCCNNYGPYQFPEKLIPVMIQNVLQLKPLPVYGDGLHVRDWLYVQDHCRALEMVIEWGRDGEVYNIGGHNERTNLEVVKTIIAGVKRQLEKMQTTPGSHENSAERCRIGAESRLSATRCCRSNGVKSCRSGAESGMSIDIDPSAIGEHLIQQVADRPGHDRRYAIDPGKIQRELGWRPQVRFEEGLALTIQWYLTHRQWLERIRTGQYRGNLSERLHSFNRAATESFG